MYSPTPARARALAHLAGLRMFAGDLDGSRIAAEEAIDLARRVGGHAEEAIGLGGPGWDMALSGDVEAGLDAFRRAIAIAEALGSVEGIGLGRTNLAALLDRIGRPSEALDVCLDGIAQTRRWVSSGRTAISCGAARRRRCSHWVAGTKRSG